MNYEQSIQAQASRWVIELSGDAVDQRSLEQFDQWYDADSRHQQAFLVAARVWAGMAAIFTPGIPGAPAVIH